MPDMVVVETPPTAASDSVRRQVKPGPSMADLRRKYLGPDADVVEAEGATPEMAAPSTDDADVEVKTVRPRHAPADLADDLGPHAVIVSRKRGVLGSQG